MTDDPITRLRALARSEHDDLSVADEAADEIERLRGILVACQDDYRAVMQTIGTESIADVPDIMRKKTDEIDRLRMDNERLRSLLFLNSGRSMKEGGNDQ